MEQNKHLEKSIKISNPNLNLPICIEPVGRHASRQRSASLSSAPLSSRMDTFVLWAEI